MSPGAASPDAILTASASVPAKRIGAAPSRSRAIFGPASPMRTIPFTFRSTAPRSVE